FCAGGYPVHVSLAIVNRLRTGKSGLAETDQEFKLTLHVELALHLVDAEQMAPAGSLETVVRVDGAGRHALRGDELHESVVLHDIGEFGFAELRVDCHRFSASSA